MRRQCMIKRTPQDIADFYGCYVAQDESGEWYMYKDKPMRNEDRGIWVGSIDDPLRIPWMTIDIPADHDWTHLYEPRPYSPKSTDSDNKEAPYSWKQVDSDNKASHQSQVHVHAEYCIVTNVNPVGLSGHVRELVSEGWRPQGGVAVEHLPKSEGYVQDCCYHQAMVRGME